MIDFTTLPRGQFLTLPPGVRIAIIDPNVYWRRPYYWATSGTVAEDFATLNAILEDLRDMEPAEVSWPESRPVPGWLEWLWRRWR